MTTTYVIELKKDEQFFYEEAAYCHSPDESAESGRVRGAVLLASSEREAMSRGWKVVWEIDHDADTTPTDDYYVSGNPQWVATLYDASGGYLGSLCGVDFATDYYTDPSCDPYARVVAAELAHNQL